jgi:hypothetical protein
VRALEEERQMKKRMAGMVLAASLLAAVPMSSAQAEELHCMPLLPDNPGCTVKCLINWTAYFVTSGGGNPGYTCSDWT